MNDSETYLTASEAAELCRYSKSTLANMRWRGTGPKFIKLCGNGGIRYRKSDVIAWIEGASNQ